MTLVTGMVNEDALPRENAPFGGIRRDRMPSRERVFDWAARRIFRSNYSSHVLTVVRSHNLICEWRPWRQVRQRMCEADSLPDRTDVSRRPNLFRIFLRRTCPIRHRTGPGYTPVHKRLFASQTRKAMELWVELFDNAYSARECVLTDLSSYFAF